ncbi:glutamate-5-semialdehyde dehydrogenase [Sphaerochaeta sp. PS]|uniref:glutamate-5-semialdehyde dehydrogenase n=1 Tax=Sphaerochaeta sp. PS TaxID=3076336 RepID=UPI0028A412A8|nr:glutamate-5-semialdehyde dehydrogenase [Sphaerochaeta sp. PS]MDT4763100.1 glutamate-5-semialdehyde dehydrogenase [Sphaerochaeta sp. PS]
MDGIRIQEDIKRLKTSATVLSVSSELVRNALLAAISDGLSRDWPAIRAANEKDLHLAKDSGLAEALTKRLIFDEEKLRGVQVGLKQVAELEDPIGKVLERRLLDKNLLLERVSFPIGVIGMIFESRPDALVQIVSLCLKSGNGIILKGGKEAFNTNTALVASIKKSAQCSPLGDQWLTLLESHSDVSSMLKMEKEIDLLIPRGSNAFVKYVMENTTIAVLGHADGICHIYVDEKADLAKALACAVDSKTQYPAACNSIETLLVHRKVASTFIPLVAKALKEKGVTIHGDGTTSSLIDCTGYQEGDYAIEYLALELNIKVVKDMDEALGHIALYGSHHTDAIISEDRGAITRFMQEVDSADVFANCSTRFADGFRFGLGAEVGISTAKIHARGPVGLNGLMSSKWLLNGNGQVVSSYSGVEGKPFLHMGLSCEGSSLLAGEGI